MNTATNPLSFPYDAPPPGGECIDIAPGVKWIRMPLPFALDHINLWLIEEADGWAVVDTGFGVEATRALWEQHFKTTLGGRPITRIILTHYHPDHIGNAQWLAERFATPEGPIIVEMSLMELLAAHHVADGSGPYQRATLADFFRAHGLTEEQVDVTANRGNTYSGGVPSRPPCCNRITPGDTLEIGGKFWTAIVGYGHTIEHLSFYCEELKLLISGDMLLPKISTNVNVWPATPLTDPVSDYVNSLQAFKYCEDDTLVLPSHGLPFRGIKARVEALETHHEDRMNDLYAAVLDSPKTAAELIPVLFRRKLDNHQLFFAIAEAVAHVNHGWRIGRLTREVGADKRIRFGLATLG
jgi:glyoxylase-like metal-dependent hydrolase (beta-lactamase superfamily II)